MQLDAKDHATALIHLYRGELARMTAYRIRLDTTTNWAVGTTGAIATFGLSDPQLPHSVLVLALLLDLVFLWMESRRFRGYAIILGRVRLLEQGFYATMLGGTGSAEWERQLAASLEHPRAPVGYLAAFSVRLRRNYLWLIGVVYLAWLLKLRLEPAPLPDGAAVASAPGWLILTGAGVLLAALVVVALLHRPGEEG